MNAPWYFEFLDIAPTNDPRAIKRAYAIALKRLDQETQAEEFARLRQAYELALAWEGDVPEDFDDWLGEEPEVEPETFSEDVEVSAVLPASSAAAAAIAYAEPSGRSAPDAPSAAQERLAPAMVAYAEPLGRNAPDAPDAPSAAQERLAAATVAYADVAERVLPAEELEHEETDKRLLDIGSEEQSRPPFVLDSLDDVPGKVEYATLPGRPAMEQGLSVEEHFQQFVARLEANPTAAESLLEGALQAEAMIALSAREHFEGYLVEWLHEQFRAPFAALFEAAARKFCWAEQPPLGSAEHRATLESCVAQWCHWLKEDEQWRETVLLAVAQARSGQIDKAPRERLRASREALHTACERYPQWMLLHLLPKQLNAWSAQISEMSRPTFWERYKAHWKRVLSPMPRQNRKVIIGPLITLVIVFTIATAHRMMVDNAGPAVVPHAAPPFARAVEAFQVSENFCRVRAKLGGRWIQLYGNELNYRSFRMEVNHCLESGYWPGGSPAAEEYLQRLVHAWSYADDPQNASMIGRETGISSDGSNRAFMLCDPRYQQDPELDPVAGGCVALAATYLPDRVTAFEVSEHFCSKRAEKPWAWHFDEGREWDNYQGFRQEVADCLGKGWWPEGVDNANAYVMQMNDYWRDRYSRLLPPLPSASSDDGHQSAPKGTTLTIGSGGRLVIGADGVQISGDVRVNGKLISPDSVTPTQKPE